MEMRSLFAAVILLSLTVLGCDSETMEIGPDVNGGTELESAVESTTPTEAAAIELEPAVESTTPSEAAAIESTAPEEADSADIESKPTAEADESPQEEAEQ
jgi:hypothetical protein